MKTKETSNQMGKCDKCGAIQFLSYGICNYNGICNGEVVSIELSTREQAMSWWKKLKSNVKLNYWREYQKITFTPSHSPDELTGREIEKIWRKETKDGSDREIIEEAFPDLKPNQKQFKQFSPELFKSYISKFSDDDKRKAFELIFDSISYDKKIKFLLDSEIIDWYKGNMY